MEIALLHQRIDRVTETVVTAFGKLDQAGLNWKPNPSIWSVGQVIDHIIVVNTSMFPTFDALLDGFYKPSLFTKVPGLARFFGGFILKSQDPANRKKSKTLPLWKPTTSAIDAGIVSRFTEHQEDLKRRYEALQGARNPIISSPAASFVVYPLNDAKELLVRHEERHLLQAQEVLELQNQMNRLGRE